MDAFWAGAQNIHTRGKQMSKLRTSVDHLEDLEQDFVRKPARGADVVADLIFFFDFFFDFFG